MSWNKAISFFEEYKKEKLKIVQTPIGWQAPPHGVYKINTDAAIFNQQGIGCLLHPALPSLTSRAIDLDELAVAALFSFLKQGISFHS